MLNCHQEKELEKLLNNCLSSNVNMPNIFKDYISEKENKAYNKGYDKGKVTGYQEGYSAKWEY